MRQHKPSERPVEHVNVPISDVPAAEPPPTIEEVLPSPMADFGGVENIPEEALSVPEQVADEMDHAGLDQELPDENNAPIAKAAVPKHGVSE